MIPEEDIEFREGRREANRSAASQAHQSRAQGADTEKPDNGAEAPVPGMTIDQLSDQLDAYSELISTRLRAVNLGTLGIAWVLLLKKDDVATLVEVMREEILLVVAAACLLALLTDLLQYLFAERAVDEAFNRAEKSETNSATFDRSSFAYRAQLFCYRLKLLVTMTAAIGLVLQIAVAVV